MSMMSILLGEYPLIGSAFADAGMILFGLLLFLYGAVFVLTILLKKNPDLYRALIGLLSVLLFLLLGIVSLDLSGVTTSATTGSFASWSSQLSSHRWLIIQLPFLLIVSAITSLLVYGQKIIDRHARTYYLLTFCSILISLLVILLIGFESMI